MAKVTRSSLRPLPSPQSRVEWISAARALSPAARIPLIAEALAAIPKTPTTDAVFFRKQLLRLQDESRVEAGVITPEELHWENSPFARTDFSRAKINFRARRHA